MGQKNCIFFSRTERTWSFYMNHTNSHKLSHPQNHIFSHILRQKHVTLFLIPKMSFNEDDIISNINIFVLNHTQCLAKRFCTQKLTMIQLIREIRLQKPSKKIISLLQCFYIKDEIVFFVIVFGFFHLSTTKLYTL